MKKDILIRSVDLSEDHKPEYLKMIPKKRFRVLQLIIIHSLFPCRSLNCSIIKMEVMNRT